MPPPDSREVDRNATRQTNWGSFDWFMGVNAAILGTLAFSTYYTAELEFGLYALALLLFTGLVWRVLRRFEYPWWLLLLVEAGLIAHLMGGYVRWGPDGSWLYWNDVFGIRYDRIVHYYNSLVAVLAIWTIVKQSDARLGSFEPFFLVMTVLGLGAAIEVLEYAAWRMIPNVGVGDYANNMEDLALNLAGGLSGLAVLAAIRKLAR